MKEISVSRLKEMIDTKEDFQLVDVREEHEFDICNLNGELIPMGEVMDNVEKISKDKMVVVHCRSGKRSATVINALEQQHGFTNLHNLQGGILAWAAEIDPSMPNY
jgi:sulfur-carrier protein adenylyltransferase/sulfurtransferase